jgi:hypothetical protein
MKKLNFYQLAVVGLVSAALAFTSCKKKDDSVSTPEFNSGTTVVQDSVHGNVHWTAGNKYLLKGYVYVTNGSTLTIDPGTVIKGDKATKGALIVERGAKIMAQGTPSNPIVFTSNQPAGSRNYGDWGGVILCGYSPNNWVAAKNIDNTVLPTGIGQVEGGPRSLYGGNNPADNSGVLSYVRIEFGGVAFSPNNEINGLTLCSVGSGTQIDHIQVSYSGDDSYEWFGGTVNCKYLVAHRGWDDDFDTDNGYAGNVQFGMILRDPNAADQSGSHSFESDSRNENATATPLTTAVFSNVTTVGPLINPGSTSYSPNFVCGAILRRTSSISIMNSLIIGYPSGVIIEDDPTYGYTTSKLQDSTLQVRNTAVVGCPTTAQAFLYRINDPHSSPNNISGDADTTTSTPFGSSAGPYTWAYALKDKIYSSDASKTRLTNPFSLTAPSFVPSSTSVVVTVPPATSPAMPASFTSSRLSSSFFDKTANYVGGFNYTGSSSDNWATGWTHFDPQNADYGSAY